MNVTGRVLGKSNKDQGHWALPCTRRHFVLIKLICSLQILVCFPLQDPTVTFSAARPGSRWGDGRRIGFEFENKNFRWRSGFVERSYSRAQSSND